MKLYLGLASLDPFENRGYPESYPAGDSREENSDGKVVWHSENIFRVDRSRVAEGSHKLPARAFVDWTWTTSELNANRRQLPVADRHDWPLFGETIERTPRCWRFVIKGLRQGGRACACSFMGLCTAKKP